MKTFQKIIKQISFRELFLFAVFSFLVLFFYQADFANAFNSKQPKQPGGKPVRGVTYSGFVTMTPIDSLHQNLLPVMWNLWKKEKWDELDTLVTRNKICSGYPPANGFVNVDTITLPVDKMLDRYGSMWGTFLADAGASYGGRALPPGSNTRPYYKYRVLKPIPNVLAGKAIPWFGEPGMGMQYMVPQKVIDLIKTGYMDSIPAKPGM